MSSLKSFKRQAGLPEHIDTWLEAAAAVKRMGLKIEKMERGLEGAAKSGESPAPVQWHRDVDVETAVADGRTPEDFDISAYDLEDLVLKGEADGTLAFEVRMSKAPPKLNHYIESKDQVVGVDYETTEWPGWVKVHVPVGPALQGVYFNLVDADTGQYYQETITETDRSGTVTRAFLRGTGSMPGRLAKGLADRLYPKGGAVWGQIVRVKLKAYARFFPRIEADGSARTDYGRDRGHLRTNMLETGCASSG